jgi:hypothetical protein
MEWIHMPHNEDKWCVLVRMVTNLRKDLVYVRNR